MGLSLSVAVMAAILTFVLAVLYKIGARLTRWALMTNKALNLLAESREIESMETKGERFKALMQWKQKRDSLLDGAESLERELSELKD